MAAVISSLSQTAIKTLNFFIQFLPLRRRHTTTSASGDTAPANDFFSHFLQISKKFPKRNPNPNPNPELPEPHRPLQYNALMSSFNRSNNPIEVLRLFRQLKDSIFFQPNLLIYTTAIDALVKSNRFQEAEDLFKEMMDSGNCFALAFQEIVAETNICQHPIRGGLEWITDATPKLLNKTSTLLLFCRQESCTCGGCYFHIP